MYVTCILDGSHFVAVFGAEHVKQFHQLSQSLEAALTNDHFTPQTQLSSRGQLVCVSHPKRGAYSAYVVNADNEKILIFSPDGGYYLLETQLMQYSTLSAISLTRCFSRVMTE